MSDEIPQMLLGVPVDQTVESGLHYVVLGTSETGTLGFRVRNSERHRNNLSRRISRVQILRAIARCKDEPAKEVTWPAARFRDWLKRYSHYCSEAGLRPEATPVEEPVKVSWYAKVGIQVKIHTDRVFPWQWFRK